MNRTTFSILFFVKKTKLNKKQEAPIYLRITVNGDRAEISIKRSIDPAKWNPSKGQAKSFTQDEKDLNQYLKHINRQVFLKQQQLEERNKVISARCLMNAYLNKDDDKKTILQVYDEHNKKLFALVGKSVALGTYQRHVTSRDHIERFIQYKYGMKDYYLKDINPEFLDQLETYFRVDRGCNNNTTVKYIRNFSKIVRLAIRNEWLSTNPLKNLKLRIEPVDKDYLTQEELHAIQSKKITIERIDQVRDIFVFCCYTGLAYIDVYSLKYSDIETVLNGSQRLKIRRQKTGQAAFIPLLPPAITIIEKYKKHPICVHKNVVLPVLSNQKMNAYLKEVADFCGIPKNLTTHCARHTFATTVTMAHDISMENVSKMLGYSSLTITRQYARILDQTVSKEMGQLAKRLYS